MSVGVLAAGLPAWKLLVSIGSDTPPNAAQWRRFLRPKASWVDYEDFRPARRQSITCLLPEVPRALLLTQKQPVFRQIAPPLVEKSVGVCLLPYPTPSIQSCNVINMLANGLKIPAFYFGDLDPIGLMAFFVVQGAIRDANKRSRRASLNYVGIDDWWLQICEREARSGGWALEDQVMSMGSRELKHFHYVEREVSDLEQLVGGKSVDLMRSGKKFEVEGVMTVSPRLLRATASYILLRMRVERR